MKMGTWKCWVGYHGQYPLSVHTTALRTLGTGQAVITTVCLSPSTTIYSCWAPDQTLLMLTGTKVTNPVPPQAHLRKKNQRN